MGSTFSFNTKNKKNDKNVDKNKNKIRYFNIYGSKRKAKYNYVPQKETISDIQKSDNLDNKGNYHISKKEIRQAEQDVFLN